MIRFPAALAVLVSLPALALVQNTIPLDAVPLEAAPLQTAPLPTQPPAYETLPAPVPQAQTAPSGPGVPSLRETHGNWEIRCISSGDCVMTQLHRSGSGSADAVFTVIKPRDMRDAEGNVIEAFAEIVVPLGVYLPGGLGLKVDQSPARAAPFERCIEEGCVVRAPISSSMIDAMRRGATATIVVFSAPEKPVQIPISLNGFTAAFQAI